MNKSDAIRSSIANLMKAKNEGGDLLKLHYSKYHNLLRKR